MNSKRSDFKFLEYAKNAHANYKTQEFLDYMMFASEEEQQFVCDFLCQHSIKQGCKHIHLEWLWFGQVLQISGSFGPLRCISRLDQYEQTLARIRNTPWLRTTKEKELYQNADETFWHLIFVHLRNVDSVVAFSQVSKLHWQVARTPGIYGPWIQRFMQYRSFPSNPFAGKPDWVQFLCLSGIPEELWNAWVMHDSQCFFMAVLSMTMLGLYVPPNAVFDSENMSITCTKEIFVKSTCRGHFTQLAHPNISSMVSFHRFSRLKYIMNKCMQ